MEWQFYLNWPVLVEEAKYRRKSQKINQKHLAQLAGVSTPTISRFEAGDIEIQVSSAIRILKVLGLIDERTLTFPNPDPKYDISRDTVLFWGEDSSKKKIACSISYEALRDHFDLDLRKSALEVFSKNQISITQKACRKYLSNAFATDGSIVLTTQDWL